VAETAREVWGESLKKDTRLDRLDEFWHLAPDLRCDDED